jgi:hypothetical protein
MPNIRIDDDIKVLPQETETIEKTNRYRVRRELCTKEPNNMTPAADRYKTGDQIYVSN